MILFFLLNQMKNRNCNDIIKMNLNKNNCNNLIIK